MTLPGELEAAHVGDPHAQRHNEERDATNTLIELMADVPNTYLGKDTTSDLPGMSPARQADGSYGWRYATHLNVRDFGAIADGSSHPLSATYGTLAAAQVKYPAATSLTNETDWAAIQSAILASLNVFTNKPIGILIPEGHYIINKRIAPRDYQEVSGVGDTTYIETNQAKNVTDCSGDAFKMGNMHPAVLLPAGAYLWPNYATNDVAAGDKTVTVTTPGSVTRWPAVGELVIFRCSTNLDTHNSTATYDFQMHNMVTSVNTSTGVVGFEKPIPHNVAAAATMTGPVLCVNSQGIDNTVNEPWSMAVSVTLRNMRLRVNNPWSRTGMWKCLIENITMENVNKIIFGNAICSTTMRNLHGTWNMRFGELAFASADSVFDNCYGTFVPDAAYTPLTTFSIHEQSYNLEFRAMHIVRGKDFTTNVPCVDICAQNVRGDFFIENYPSSAVTNVPVSFSSNDNLFRPCSDITASFEIRNSAVITSYVTIGSNVSSSDPTRIVIPVLRCKSATGVTPPTNTFRIWYSSNVKVGEIHSDSFGCLMSGTGEVPQGAPIQAAGNLQGLNTFTANTDTVVQPSAADFPLKGVRPGDQVVVTMIPNIAPTSGSRGDLYATATVISNDTVRVYIRNRSGTTVGYTGGGVMERFNFYYRRTSGA